MTTLHRGPRNSNPLEAVAQRRHAELDAQFDHATGEPMSDEQHYRAALARIASLWDAQGDPDTNRAACIAREALIGAPDWGEQSTRTTAPINALPDYDA